MVTDEEVTTAKVALRSLIQEQPWLRGIGISGDKQGKYITVRVAKESFDNVKLPIEVNGVRVVKEVGEIAHLFRRR